MPTNEEEMSFLVGEKTLRIRLFLLPIFLYLALYVHFLRSYGYGWMHPEVIASLGFWLVVGCIYGLLFLPFRKPHHPIRVLLLAGMFLFALDVQTKTLMIGSFARTWRIWLILLILFGFLAWLFLRYLEALLFVSLAFFFLLSCVWPRQAPLPFVSHFTPLSGTAKVHRIDKTKKKPPIWIHIVLDAHIGLEGLPHFVDPKGSLVKKIRADYIKHGFHLFGRTHSLYTATINSLKSLFTSTRKLKEFNYEMTISEKENDYFRLLKQKGMKLHVYRSSLVKFCRPSRRKKPNRYLSACWVYPYKDIRVISDYSLSLWNKTLMLLGQYKYTSILIYRAYNLLFRFIPRPIVAGQPILFPLVGEHVLKWSARELVHAKAGDAFLIHAIIPHSPYLLDKHCRIVLPTTIKRKGKQRWAFRYRVYVRQLQCAHKRILQLFSALKQAGVYDKATILIHGDHGSRNALHSLYSYQDKLDKVTTQDFLDLFSAHFAFKAAGAKKGKYDQRELSIYELFRFFVHGEKLVPKASKKPSLVYFYTRDRKLRSVKMPSFRRRK